MSELREECCRCLNNSNCLSAVDYGSIYCRLNRKYDLKNIDYGKEKDMTVIDKFVSIQTIKNKISELEEQYKEALEENSTKSFILKCQIEGFKDFEKELLYNK